jgi:hypothetical protein
MSPGVDTPFIDDEAASAREVPADTTTPSRVPQAAPDSSTAESSAAPGKRAKRKSGSKGADPTVSQTDSPDPTPATEDAQAADGNWVSVLQMGDRRTIKGSDLNASLALEHAPELVGKIAYDVRSGSLVALKPGPLDRPARGPLQTRRRSRSGFKAVASRCGSTTSKPRS